MSKEAAQKVKRARVEINLKDSDITRFWKYVNKNGQIPDQSVPFYDGLGNCWEWTGGKFHFGHGAFWLNGKTIGAHTVSFTIFNGPIPKHESFHGMCVCHKCDNPKCVNPEHLFLGTMQDDHRDRDVKGRGSKGKKHAEICAPFLRKGSSHGASKLTEQQVIEMREAYAKGENALSISKRYPVCHASTWQIVTRKVWKHV